MLRAWPKATIAALVTGAAIAAQLAGLGPAQASVAPTISIGATTKFKPVTDDSFVVYHISGYNSAKLHGAVAGAKVGEVAALYAQQFPYTEPAARIGSITLQTTKTTVYTFTVTPSLATHYAVRLFANAKSTAQIATSRMVPIYVTSDQSTSALQKCSRPVCHESLQIDTYVPASALSVEMSKHVYPYFGINLGSSSIPPSPAYLYLNAGGAKVTPSVRISAGEFQNTLTFSFTIGNHSYNFLPAFCTKDAVTTDGLGLPGGHDCGVSRIPSNLTYLG